MLIYFYFVLFFIAKCLNFCCEECCGDCCCDWWYNLWEDCYKKSNKEEDCLNDYRKGQERMYLQNIEEIRKQKEELKNKIRQYLSHIKNDVENIKRNIGEKNSIKEENLKQFSKINELIENFQNDNYFVRNSIEQIQKDWEDLQGLCSNAGIIKFDDFYKKNEEWKKFLEYNGIQEQYEEEKIINQENFSLENTLVKLRNNFGTYLLEIFKTRLFPTNENGDKYKNEIMAFYEKYNIATWISFLTEESFNTFYENICKMTSGGLNKDIDVNCRNLLLINKSLGFALLSDGDENQILNVFYNNIDFVDNMQQKLIANFIDHFKRNIVTAIKESINQNLEIENDLKKNNSENIKKIAFNNYNEAIKNLNVEKIKLTFYNSYNKKMKIKSFFKDCKLSVLFDYVLSKGRKFYASNEERKIVEDKLGYVSYEDEKGKLELKTAQGNWGDSLNKKINQNENITIGEFYEKQFPNVFMFFKKE